jgi:cysteine sulfinate desulfinase/cysteine desulfurase-like protein
MKRGLYSNIHAKRERIAAGSKERMRRPGTKGAPTAKAFRQSAKTAKKK